VKEIRRAEHVESIGQTKIFTNFWSEDQKGKESLEGYE
jgi:hypothetical protein